MGRSFPRYERQGIIEVLQRRLGRGTGKYYSVSGSPAQAVVHGILEIATRRPSLCISGINNGENLGGTNLISGTVGAALEANSYGIPALAVSLGPENPNLFGKRYHAPDWQVPTAVIRHLSAGVLRGGLPFPVMLLNVNIPASATCETSLRVTRQSRLNPYVCVSPKPRDFAKPFQLAVIEQVDYATLEPDSDLYAFFIDRVISVTPMGGDLTVCDASGAPVDVLAKTSSCDKPR
jgi:5'-nucleotidase